MNIIGLDFETFYGHDYTLRKMSTEAYIRDPRFKAHGAGIKINDRPSVWVPGRLLEPVLKRLDWENSALLGHNLNFDGTILNWHYGIKPKQYIDTLGMSRALVGQHNARHGLEFVAKTLVNMSKMDGLVQSMNIRDLSPEQEQKLANYCIAAPHWNPTTQRMEAGDTELTWAIYQHMLPHFPENEYYIMDWTIRQFAQPKLLLDADMLEVYIDQVRDMKQMAIEDVYYRETMGGFKYYVHAESESLLRSNEPVDECEEVDRSQYIEYRNNGYSFDGVTPEQFEEVRKMLASADKYAAALESLGVIPPVKINAKGQIKFAFAKTDEAHKALLEYDQGDDQTNAQVQALVAARLEVKSTIEETRAVKYFDAAPRGPWPVDYNYAGAKNTHRLSGANGGGGNPTNLKRGGQLRKCIYAPDGKILVVADLSQIEARLVLWLGSQMPRAGDERIALDLLRKSDKIKAEITRLYKAGQIETAKKLKAIAYKYDIYCTFGSMMYGYEVSGGTERQVAKSAVLGLGFGMGPSRFMDYCKAMGIRIEPIMAESAVALYRNTYTGVRQYWSCLDRTMKSAVYDGVEALRIPLQLERLPVCEVVREPLFGHVALKSYSGLMLKYPDLEWNAEGEGTYRDGNGRVKIFGGKFVENEVQHLARCILMDMLRRIDPVYPCVMSTYDELVMMVDEDEVEQCTAFATKIMTTDHPQFPGLPLGVETGSAKRYGEAKT